MEVLFKNSFAITWIAIVVMSIVPVGLTFWFKAHKAEIDAQLKMRMLEMGMSAADIERVLRAGSSADTSKD